MIFQNQMMYLSRNPISHYYL